MKKKKVVERSDRPSPVPHSLCLDWLLFPGPNQCDHLFFPEGLRAGKLLISRICFPLSENQNKTPRARSAPGRSPQICFSPKYHSHFSCPHLDREATTMQSQGVCASSLFIPVYVPTLLVIPFFFCVLVIFHATTSAIGTRRWGPGRSAVSAMIKGCTRFTMTNCVSLVWARAGNEVSRRQG